MHTHIYIYTYSYIYIIIHIYMYIYMIYIYNVHMIHVPVYLLECVCVPVYACTFMHILCIYMLFICSRIYIYIHTYAEKNHCQFVIMKGCCHYFQQSQAGCDISRTKKKNRPPRDYCCRYFLTIWSGNIVQTN